MSTQTASDILNATFLELRAKLLEVAAVLDRIERADGAEEAKRDPRYRKIQQAVDILKGDAAAVEAGLDTVESDSRAQLVQLLFSRPYDPQWPTALEVAKPR